MVSGVYDGYNLISSNQLVQPSESVRPIQPIEHVQEVEEQVVQTVEQRKTLPGEEVLKHAMNYGMKVDKNLIGNQVNLDQLDFKKEVNQLQKDSILREYQFFVNDSNSLDGFVIRKPRLV